MYKKRNQQCRHKRNYHDKKLLDCLIIIQTCQHNKTDTQQKTHIVDQQTLDLHAGGDQTVQVLGGDAEFLQAGGDLQMLDNVLQGGDDPCGLLFVGFVYCYLSKR